MALGGLVAIVAVVVVAVAFSAVHKVHEGHVAVYYRGGALLPVIEGPGYHAMMPFVSSVSLIQVTMQTDLVSNIPCGTRGGVMIYFDSIEVVNRLKKESVFETIRDYGVNYDKLWVFDKIHHEINQFCSKHTLQEVYIEMFDEIDEAMKEALQKDCTKYAPGLEIINVRVTKPKLPESIRQRYEELEREKMALMIAQQRQQVMVKEAETEKKRAIAEAEKSAEVAKINQLKTISEKQTSQTVASIENEMALAQAKATTDALVYQIQEETKAMKNKLSPEFLQLSLIQSIANNTKIFFGSQLPSMFFKLQDLPKFAEEH